MKTHHYTIRFLILVGCLILLDVMIKAIIASRFQPTEMIDVAKGFIVVGRIQNVSIAFGLQSGFPWAQLVRIFFQILMLLLAIRIQQRPVAKGYKYGSAMIVGGIVGNYIDRLLFSNGTPGFHSTGYFLIHPIEGFHSISSLLITAGWLVVIVSIIISFKDLKVIFGGASS